MTYEEYSELPAVHYSGLKIFSKCPRLYFEKYIEKSYVEPEHDYFLYGHLVDCLVTEPGTLESRFVKVSRRSNGSTLDLEVKASVIEAEINERAPLAAAGNKVAIKGLASRKSKLEELKAQIEEARSFGNLTQVPGAIWDDAIGTAEVIKQLPMNANLVTQGFECQNQVPFHVGNRKGMVDRLYVKGKQVIIEDVKTTYRLKDLDPMIYAGQLAYYRFLAELSGYEVLGCFASVGDKGERKLAQDFEYSKETLAAALAEVLKTEELLNDAIRTGEFPSAKSFRGREQECLSCSECSIRPFSTDSPLII